MKYKSTKNKIQKIYRKAKSVEYEIENIPKIRFKEVSTHREDNFYHVANEWVSGKSGTITLILEGFPEDFIPFIRFTPILRIAGMTPDNTIWIDKVKEQQEINKEEVTGNYITYFSMLPSIDRITDEPRIINVGGQEVEVFDYKCKLYVGGSIITLDSGEPIPIEIKLMITIANNRLTHEIQKNKK